MFDTIRHTLSADVASSGTFTISYPANRSAGSYTGSWRHKLWVNQTLFSAPGHFTLTFGASSVTVTWLGSTTLTSGSAISIQVDTVGAEDGQPEKAVLPDNVSRTPLFRIDLGAPDVNDSDGICASQSVTASVQAVVNGAIGATLDVARNVVASWTGTAILTVTGKDIVGNTVVEKSASGTSLTGKKAFKSVTSLLFSANVTSATIGTGNVIGLPVYVPSGESIVEEMVDGVAFGRAAGKVFLPFEIEQTELLAPTAEQIVCPVDGWISRLRGIVQGAVTTGGAITVEVNTVAVTGLTITIADADAAGVRYSDAPTTRHGSTTVVAKGDQLTITPGSAIATAGQLNGILEIDASRAGQLDGTFVAGVTSAATATTGDTRGTYAPSITPDGAIQFALLASLADPANVGVPQYTG